MVCPRCKDNHVHEVAKRPWHWQCWKCNKNGYRFSVITGTIFENTNLSNKTMVLGAISRKENVVAQMVEEAQISFGDVVFRSPISCANIGGCLRP